MSRARPRGTSADLRRMLAVLAQERSALLQADFDRLERLAPRKAALLSRLEENATSDLGCEPLARQMRRAAARNAGLYEAAIAGIRDARAMIDFASNPPPGHVYGRNGGRRTLDSAPGSLERRA